MFLCRLAPTELFHCHVPHLRGLLLLHWADTARLLARGGSVVYGLLLWLLVVWRGAVCHDGREGTAGPGTCSILCYAVLACAPLPLPALDSSDSTAGS